MEPKKANNDTLKSVIMQKLIENGSGLSFSLVWSNFTCNNFLIFAGECKMLRFCNFLDLDVTRYLSQKICVIVVKMILEVNKI